MDDLHDQIERYSELSPEEQLAVDLYVARHPEYAPFLEEARAWDELFLEGRRLLGSRPSDEALALYAAGPRSASHVPPPGLRVAFARIEQALGRDPERRARLDQLQRRGEALERASDAVAGFERVTGHRLDEPPTVREVGSGRWHRFVVSYQRASAWGMAAVLVCAALYGVLVLGARVMQSDLERLGVFAESELQYAAYGATFRSTSSPFNLSPAAMYLAAMACLQEALPSPFNPFGRRDERKTAEAVRYLEAVLSDAQDPRLRSAAGFQLGKIRFNQGVYSRGEPLLREAASGSGVHAHAARRLLVSMEQAVSR